MSCTLWLLWTNRPQLSIATAIVFYHRFYARESYEHYERFQVRSRDRARRSVRRTCPQPLLHPPWGHACLLTPWALLAQVATTCLFLASKVEETPKKLRDVIVETYKVQHSTVTAPESDQELWRLKEQVLICERELLRVLGFDLTVDHAYRRALALSPWAAVAACRPRVLWPAPTLSFVPCVCRPLLAYVKSISGPRDLAQIAWNFINDSLRTTVCLQYAPRCLAAAAASMASQYLEMKGRPFPLPPWPKGSGGHWTNAFQVREQTVESIVSQIKQMYDDNKGGSNGPVGLANSGAIEKMRMHRENGNAGGSSESSRRSEAPQDDSLKRERSEGQPPVKAENEGDAAPPGKRVRADAT